MFSAYLTLVFVIVHYVVSHKDNPFDVAVFGWVNPATRRAKKWNSAMEAAVITFGDTQILTGIAILLGAFIQLPHGISSYHWQVVVSLAWFSTLTHLLALKSQRHVFRNRREMAAKRAVLMSFVMILFVTALGPTVYLPWDGVSLAAPALCLFSKNVDPDKEHFDLEVVHASHVFILILSIAFLVTNHVTNVIGLFTKVPEALQSWLKSKVSNLLKHVFESAARPTKYPKVKAIQKAGVLLIYVLSKAFYEIFDSMIWQVRTSQKNSVLLVQAETL